MTAVLGVFFGFLGCAKPTPVPGKLAPAPNVVSAVPATPMPTTFTCTSPGAEIGDEARRVCVPYAGAPRGDAQALITVVVFSDFQCPFCSRALGTLDKLEQSYPGKLRFYFRHMPLSFHANAKLAAQAAVAAENQGRFWAMHDLLFAHQSELARDSLLHHAQSLGLDMGRFEKDLDAPDTLKRIAEDLELAKALTVQGTPNFFINGRNVRGAVPVDDFKKVIDDELLRAQKMGMQGASGYSFYAALMKGDGKPAPAPEPPKITVGDLFNIEVGDVPQKGGKAPKATLIAFMDFQCPYSARAMKTLDALLAHYKDDLRIAFRHYPLPFHPNAMNAALAAVAAEEQGKFWEMSELLFGHQQDLTRPSTEKLAASMGLDMAKYAEAVANPKNKARVEAEVKLAVRVGAAGTPSFFINGRSFAGAYPTESFVVVIDEELKRANSLLASGVPQAGLYAELTKGGLDKAPPKNAEARPGEPQPGQTYKADIKGAPAKGAKDALVTIVEFADFQCPFCGRVDETLAQLLKDYAGKLRLVWRNLPLPFHHDAKRAASAAVAAGRQGKFWEMHDVLLKQQADLSDEAIQGYAKELGLDLRKFKASMKDEKIAKSIDDEMAAASKLGVRGTPAFFINGAFLSGAQPLDRFKERIDEAMADADVMVKKGTPKAKVYDAIMKAALAEVEKPAPAPDDGKPPQKVEVGNAPSRGPADAPVTLVVFSDFECPFCSRLEASLVEVERSYPGKLRVVWKNFPLSFHTHARASAEAAMAAHEQGKFWAMQAKLFEHQSALDEGDLENYAREIGLDITRFKEAMSSHKFAAAIEADMKQGSSLGVEGTPATFVNGHLIVGAQPPSAFKGRVDEELAKASTKQK
jgi:protein-disulfide isomerase